MDQSNCPIQSDERQLKWRHVVTVDASYNHQLCLTGIGIVLRERHPGRRTARVIEQIAESHADIPRNEGEAFAILRGIEIARDRGFTHLKVQSDYNYLRRCLRRLHADGTLLPPDTISGRILQLALTFESIDFHYRKRRKNILAHTLARQGAKIIPQPTSMNDLSHIP